DGRFLASASSDNTLRLWDPATGHMLGILVGGRDGLWVGCQVDPGRCRRYDDGTLLIRRDKKSGRIRPVSLPAGFGPVELVIESVRPDDGSAESGLSPPVLSPGDGESVPVILRVRNPGPETAYWLRIYQERADGDPFLFTPPPRRRVRLGPGEIWEAKGAVSYLAAGSKPQSQEGKLKLRLEQAHGEPVSLEFLVLGRAPELTLVGEPEQTAGDVSTLTVQVRNTGKQALQEAEFEARISNQIGGSDRQLAQVTEDTIPAGQEIALSFALPEAMELNEDSRLSLMVRELSYPPHDWAFPDLPIRLATPPWQRYAGLMALLLALSVLLWSLRQYTHPLTRRLAAEPALLPRLGLGQLDQARRLLRRTRRLDTVLAANGIHGRWLDQALRFRQEPTEERIKWLAHRLGADWQRMEGLGTDGAIERFDLRLGEDFPLNLKTCSVVFPPADWSEQEILSGLARRDQGRDGGDGDQICLVLAGNPGQQADLSDRCRTPDNWLVAPRDAELSELLLDPEPVEACARLIAGYVKVARISPYQTRLGVKKEGTFFGRTQIISDIQHRGPANYLLVGGRQLGKSSLLLALKRRYDQDAGVDCRYVSVGQASIESRLARTLGMPTDSSLAAVLDRLGEIATGKRRLLLLDESDVFVRQDAARGYACLNGFRSLSDEGRCQFILAGFWSLYRSASFDYQSPIKNFAETIGIGALEPEACRELVVRPMAALNLHYASDALITRILDLAGGRANLIAIICDRMLQGLGLAQRELTAADLERALESRSLHSALEGWGSLTGDETSDRLDRVIVYGLIEQAEFTLAQVLDLLTGLGYEAAPERVKESLTRLELAFLIGRSQDRFRWQVPLWRDRVRAEEPRRMLERELEAIGSG
ncbi:AAA family ATPase, partial [Candidatus Thiosymbion oneisti]